MADALDPTFAKDGVSDISVEGEPSSEPTFAGLAVARDGSLIVAGTAGYNHIARWSADGRRPMEVRQGFDPRFRQQALIRASDGTLVLAGLTGDLGEEHSSLARVSGRLGQTVLRVTTSSGVAVSARALAQAPDGSFVIGGAANVGGRRQWLLSRFLASGDPDSRFGSGGTTSIPVSRADEPVIKFASYSDPHTQIHDLAVQGDGKIVAVGTSIDRPRKRKAALLARFLPSGAPDREFGSDGFVLLSGNAIGKQVELQESRIAVSLQRADRTAAWAVMRRLANGTPDPTFGDRGKVVFAPISAWPFGADGLVALHDGGIGVSGAAEGAVAVARLTSRGRFDTRFGAAGLACAPVDESTYYPVSTSLTTQSPDRVVVAAETGGNGYDDLHWMLARFRLRTTPLDCFSVSYAPHGKAEVRFALARPGRLGMEVFSRSCSYLGPLRRLGIVSFGRRPAGLLRLPWSRRVGRRRVSPGACYRAVPVLLDRRGRIERRFVDATYNR